MYPVTAMSEINQISDEFATYFIFKKSLGMKGIMVCKPPLEESPI